MMCNFPFAPITGSQVTQPSRRVDQPTPGFYLVRIVPKGPFVGASITLHDDGTWSVMRDGITEGPATDPWELPLMHHVFLGRFSTEEEVKFRIGLARWAAIYKPDHPAANPTKAINIDKLIPF
jgi:hypothetical protein